MNLGPDIEVRIIDGTNTSERQKIQDEFNSSSKKIALFISGSTADVGIDLTAGEHIIHVNEPWTQAELDQQEARVYRY
jgi:SNF2 family DNA or RNA helicase